MESRGQRARSSATDGLSRELTIVCFFPFLPASSGACFALLAPVSLSSSLSLLTRLITSVAALFFTVTIGEDDCGGDEGGCRSRDGRNRGGPYCKATRGAASRGWGAGRRATFLEPTRAWDSHGQPPC